MEGFNLPVRCGKVWPSSFIYEADAPAFFKARLGCGSAFASSTCEIRLLVTFFPMTSYTKFMIFESAELRMDSAVGSKTLDLDQALLGGFVVNGMLAPLRCHGH